jgi:hypothetical protein
MYIISWAKNSWNVEGSHLVQRRHQATGPISARDLWCCWHAATPPAHDCQDMGAFP